MKKRKNFKSTKSLPYGFKMKRRQKYPRNVLFSYRASKNTPNKTKKIAHNYSYKNFSYSISYGANFSKSLFWGTQFNKVTCRYCQFNNAKFLQLLLSTVILEVVNLKEHFFKIVYLNIANSQNPAFYMQSSIILSLLETGLKRSSVKTYLMK